MAARKRRRLEELDIEGYIKRINDNEERGTFDESVCLVDKAIFLMTDETFSYRFNALD